MCSTALGAATTPSTYWGRGGGCPAHPQRRTGRRRRRQRYARQRRRHRVRPSRPSGSHRTTAWPSPAAPPTRCCRRPAGLLLGPAPASPAPLASAGAASPVRSFHTCSAAAACGPGSRAGARPRRHAQHAPHEVHHRRRVLRLLRQRVPQPVLQHRTAPAVEAARQCHRVVVRHCHVGPADKVQRRQRQRRRQARLGSSGGGGGGGGGGWCGHGGGRQALQGLRHVPARTHHELEPGEGRLRGQHANRLQGCLASGAGCTGACQGDR